MTKNSDNPFFRNCACVQFKNSGIPKVFEKFFDVIFFTVDPAKYRVRTVKSNQTEEGEKEHALFAVKARPEDKDK